MEAIKCSGYLRGLPTDKAYACCARQKVASDIKRGDKIIADWKKIRNALKGYIAHLFPQRQIIIRAEGQVRFFSLSRQLQVVLAVIAVMLAGWVVYASTVYFVYNSIQASYKRIISDKDAALERSVAAYRDVLVYSMEQSGKILAGERRMRQNQRHLLDILAQNAALERSFGHLKEDLKRSQNAHAQMVAARDALIQDLKQLDNQQKKLLRRNASLNKEVALIQGKLDAAVARNGEVIADQEALRKQLAAADDKNNQLTEAKALLSQKLNDLKNELGQVKIERFKMTAQRVSLERSIKSLKQQITDYKEIHRKIIAKFTQQTISNNDEVEKTLALTGIDVSCMLAKLCRTSDEDSQSSGEGGPFIAYVSELGERSPHFAHMREIGTMLAALDGHMERWEGLNQLLRQLPLSAPLDQYRITSPFGKRRDPITGEAAMHCGIDLSSNPKAPVLATAPGTVMFAGWKGRYGKFVEIDHGMGIRTCYGHLRKIIVKKGQKVRFRQKIGILGSTGRSTGLHVHYEVRVNGKPYDPLKLMKAGRYVFKG